MRLTLLAPSRVAAAGATEVPATGRACSVVCQSPLLLANALKTQPASYACVAKIGSSSVPGYQSGAGSTTCIAVSNEQAVTAENYNCLCLVIAYSLLHYYWEVAVRSNSLHCSTQCWVRHLLIASGHDVYLPG